MRKRSRPRTNSRSFSHCFSTLPFFIPRRAVVACPPLAPLLHLLLSLRVHRTNADYALSDSNRTERGSLRIETTLSASSRRSIVPLCLRLTRAAPPRPAPSPQRPATRSQTRPSSSACASPSPPSSSRRVLLSCLGWLLSSRRRASRATRRGRPSCRCWGTRSRSPPSRSPTCTTLPSRGRASSSPEGPLREGKRERKSM